MGAPEPANCLFPDRSQIVERTGALPLWSAALAVVYRRRFRYRRRGKAGSKPVAILATVDRGSLITAGATEQARNRGAHGRPNTMVRSAHGRRIDLGAAGSSIQQGSGIVDDDVRCFDRCFVVISTT
jgi:hypothetical protein